MRRKSWGRPSGCGCTPLHRDAPLHTLPDLLLPVIKHRQYVVATEQGRPVFFMSQAWLSPEAEARYLTQPAILMPQSDWNSGDRMWVCDWVAPFGHTPDMSRLVRQDIFPVCAGVRCTTVGSRPG